MLAHLEYYNTRNQTLGGSVCFSGSLDNLALENSRVVEEDEEGDF